MYKTFSVVAMLFGSSLASATGITTICTGGQSMDCSSITTISGIGTNDVYLSAGAGGDNSGNPTVNRYGMASIDLTAMTLGPPRLGILKFTAGASADGTMSPGAAASAAAFLEGSQVVTSGGFGGSFRAGNSFQIELGVPFDVSAEAYFSAAGSIAVGAGASASIEIQVFELDRVTPVSVFDASSPEPKSAFLLGVGLVCVFLVSGKRLP